MKASFGFPRRGLFRFRVARQDGVSRLAARQIGEYGIKTTPFNPFSGGRNERCIAFRLGHVVPDHHETVRIGIGQRSDEDGVEGAEDRGNTADAER